MKSSEIHSVSLALLSLGFLMTIGLSLLAVVLAYLVGAIPVAYLVVYAVKRVDIRTVGSGNVGATNAGRVLGRPFFWMVFFPDLLKGYLPTWGFARVVEWIGGAPVPNLPVLVAVAAILGHNFPIYLGFKGGKGVATSLGAVFALDPVAAGAAAFSFVVILLVTRMVSMSSMLGGIIFVFVHFTQVKRPFAPNQIVLSVVLLMLLFLLIFRHRANLARIAQGTEPRISFSKKKKSPPSGSVRVWLLVGLLAVSSLVGLLAWSAKVPELACGPVSLRLIDRAQTGHQRSEDVRFLDQGRRLAVSCPRYDRVVLYDTSARSLRKLVDIPLDGKPVALRAIDDRLYILQRPTHDARHLVPGFWKVYDLDGQPVGPRFDVGYDPDDLVLIHGGRVALVLTSGHAEGEENRPDPALTVFDLTDPSAPRKTAHLAFTRQRDDPDRLVLSQNGTHAAVVLRGSNRVVSLHLADPLHPEVVGSTALTSDPYPSLSRSDSDSILMPVDTDRRVVRLDQGDPDQERFDQDLLLGVVPEASAVEVLAAGDHGLMALGRLVLRGRLNLGSVLPVAIDSAPSLGLVAVADRSGGVHLIALEPRSRPTSVASMHANLR